MLSIQFHGPCKISLSSFLASPKISAIYEMWNVANMAIKSSNQFLDIFYSIKLL